MLRQLIRDYFSFTQKERIAVITLALLILSLYFLPYVIQPAHKLPSAREVQEFKMLEQQIAKANPNLNRKNNYDDDEGHSMAYALPAGDNAHRNIQLFYFDPNTVSETGWKQLGLRDRTIRTITKYLSGGGHFYKASDLRKIYGLHQDEYERLAPYIRINEPSENNSAQWPGSKQWDKRKHVATGVKPHGFDPSSNYSMNGAGADATVKIYPAQNQAARNTSAANALAARNLIDINIADTAAWIALPGIGSKLANRIVQFRDRLGGFHDVTQIGETFGLADSVFQKIRPLLIKSKMEVRKINVNTASVETLKMHPYIRWELAGALVRYREQHGAFKTLEELQQIGAISPEAYKKMLPYLVIEDQEIQ